jgi:hypothetical protein
MNFFISDWFKAKVARATYYFSYVYGWRQKDCTACSGSGRYDSHGSPKCGACNGKGKETYRGPKAIDNAIVRCAPQLAALAKRMEEERKKIK